MTALRIGIIDRASPGWEGGGVYSRTAARSLTTACAASGDEVFFLTQAASAPAGTERLQLEPFDFFPGERQLRRALSIPPREGAIPGEARIRRALHLGDRSDPFDVARRHRLSVLFPVPWVPVRTSGVRAIGWIPDFQHLFLPELFSGAELHLRDHGFRQLGRRADAVVLSSEAARRHLQAFDPSSLPKARVVPFASRFAHDPPVARDPSETLRKYQLPPRFALVVNQFWAHKDPGVVVEAAARLRAQGITVPVVLVGLPLDYRDPQNRTLSSLLQAIAANGLWGQCSPLGRVAEHELIDLLRCAALILQPSRFEGWNTTLEDAKALGRPVLCSDLEVHREQCPDALGFFPPGDAPALAALLARTWPALAAGPDAGAESHALESARAFARLQGQRLLEVCRQVVR